MRVVACPVQPRGAIGVSNGWLREGPSGFSPASNALTLLNGGAGLGGQGGINLLLSGL